MTGANVCTLDRLGRIALGIALIALVFVGPRTSWGWVGLVPLMTGIGGLCPAYLVFGVRPFCRDRR